MSETKPPANNEPPLDPIPISTKTKSPAPTDDASAPTLQHLVENISTSLAIELGRVTVSVTSLGKLKSGHIIELSKKPGELVDLVIENKSIGKGELVLIEGELGVKIVSIIQ